VLGLAGGDPVEDEELGATEGEPRVEAEIAVLAAVPEPGSAGTTRSR